MNVFLGHDLSFQTKFGANSVQKMLDLLNLAQNYYYWPSLTTRIRLNVVGTQYYPSLSLIATTLML